MRMVMFSVILMVVIIFARRGIMGRREFSWDGLCRHDAPGPDGVERQASDG